MTNVDEMMKNTETRQSLTVLQKSFSHNVGMGDLIGVEALLEQLRRYSLYFSDPQLHLQHVEELVPGVVTATAQLSLTVSEFTLRCVFPHLEVQTRGDEVEDQYRLLRNKLLGQKLTSTFKISFLVDEETGRVARLDTRLNLMSTLFQLLQDASEVSTVLNQALLNMDCVVSNLVDHPQFGSRL